LSLGIANGDLFDAVVAFSPGFAASMVQHGIPRLFISHGINDEVLPIWQTPTWSSARSTGYAPATGKHGNVGQSRTHWRRTAAVPWVLIGLPGPPRTFEVSESGGEALRAGGGERRSRCRCPLLTV
jgi:hypothetical protein